MCPIPPFLLTANLFPPMGSCHPRGAAGRNIHVNASWLLQRKNQSGWLQHALVSPAYEKQPTLL